MGVKKNKILTPMPCQKRERAIEKMNKLKAIPT
jgi:hypothetical protein